MPATTLWESGLHMASNSMKSSELVEGLRSLGIKSGDVLLVHSSLGSLGPVDGGADTVIDALMEVLGEDGLLVMPTFASPDRVFDRKTSPSGLGIIPDTFWRRPQVLRSMHPTHSVAAWGKRAMELIADHEKASDAYGEGTPYKKIADWGGKILLLGVDLDRCTTLHTVEALVDAPYLRTTQASYMDDNEEVHKIKVERMAGPHRSFIGLNKPFLQSGIMVKNKIGNATCSLIDAHKMIEFGVAEMKKKPDLMLCDNPECFDCRRQRGIIKKRRFEEYSCASIGANVMEISQDLEETMRACGCEGIYSVEFTMGNLREGEAETIKSRLDSLGIEVCTLDLGRKFMRGIMDPFLQAERAANMAKILGTENVVFSVMPTSEITFLKKSGFLSHLVELGQRESITFMMENMALPGGDFKIIVDALNRVNSPHLRLAFNPGNFAIMGGRPFLDIFPLKAFAPAKTLIGAVYLNDAIKGGSYTPIGEGNGEIKELTSILLSRGFQGPMVLKSNKIPSLKSFKDECDRFWDLIWEVL